LEPGNYILSEERTNGYRGLWSGKISTGGTISLAAGEDLTVVRTNYDMNPTDDTTEVETPAPTTTPKPTVNGGRLPDTSSPWWNLLLLGGGLVALSGVGFTSRKFLVK
jgi:LPXTG-motif cell wall-anchored protein